MIIDNRYHRIKSIFGYRLRALVVSGNPRLQVSGVTSNVVSSLPYHSDHMSQGSQVFRVTLYKDCLGRSLGSSKKSVHERHQNSDGWQVK